MATLSFAASYHDAVLSLHGPLIVRGVFDRAWHLHDAEDRVVSVVAAAYDGPMAIRVDAPSLRHAPIRLGMRGRLHHDALEIGPVHLSLLGARRWPTPREDVPLRLSQLSHDLEKITAVLLTPHPAGDSLGWLQPAGDRMDELRNAMIAGNGLDTREAARGLLGLGPGLTPAGDDVLTGLLTGLHVLGERTGRSEPRHLGDWVSQEALHRTIPLSRTLLSWAARGIAAQPLLDVLWNLGSEHSIGSLGTLLAIGHSSGRDMLAGAALAASVILGREERSGAAMAGPAQRVPRLG